MDNALAAGDLSKTRKATDNYPTSGRFDHSFDAPSAEHTDGRLHRGPGHVREVTARKRQVDLDAARHRTAGSCRKPNQLERDATLHPLDCEALHHFVRLSQLLDQVVESPPSDCGLRVHDSGKVFAGESQYQCIQHSEGGEWMGPSPKGGYSTDHIVRHRKMQNDVTTVVGVLYKLDQSFYDDT